MRDGFISVAAGTPKIRVADCRYNAEQTFQMMRAAEKAGVKVLVLPELGLTGYTCGDLFYQDTLLKSAEEALATVLEATRNLEVVTAVGMPVRVKDRLYYCAAIIQKGIILGLVPKVHLPNDGEFYEIIPKNRKSTILWLFLVEETHRLNNGAWKDYKWKNK